MAHEATAEKEFHFQTIPLPLDRRETIGMILESGRARNVGANSLIDHQDRVS